MDANYLDFMMQMAEMGPQDEKLKRKQAQVDALRKQAMAPLQGQMIGKHYVAPGIGQALAQVGTAYLGAQQQGDVDKGVGDFNAEMRRRIDELRKKKFGGGVADYGDPISNWARGAGTGGD